MNRLSLRFRICVSVCWLLVVARNQAAIANDRLDELLREWQQASAQIRLLETDFKIYQYESIFELERRGTGRLAIDDKGLAYYCILPSRIERNEKSSRRGDDGDRYSLQTITAHRWFILRRMIVRIDDVDRSFVECERDVPLFDEEFFPDPPDLPEEDDAVIDVDASNKDPGDGLTEIRKQSGDDPENSRPMTFFEGVGNFVIGALIGAEISAAINRNAKDWKWAMPEAVPFTRPYLLGMSIDELKDQFRIKLLKESPAEVWLEFKSIGEDPRFERAVLILDLASWRPRALQLFDATDTETVYVFHKMQINRKFKGKGPFQIPKLKGYSRF